MLETLASQQATVFAAVMMIVVAASLLGYLMKLLSASGATLASIVGIAAFFFGGIVPFFTLLVFYVVAEFCTWFGRRGAKRHERRAFSNIFSNCIAALAALFMGNVPGFFGAVSATFADTISSEIGLLSSRKPVLITTFREVEPGTDGGVTALGLAASLVAATIIGSIYYFFVDSSAKLFAVVVIAGFFGGIVDSLLGATLQRRGMLTNTQVNFFAGIFGAVLAISLGKVF